MKRTFNCHAAHRTSTKRALVGALVLASAGLTACGANHGENNADLDAILEDGDLSTVMRGALMVAPTKTDGGVSDGGGSVAGSSGSAGPGSAGTTGTTTGSTTGAAGAIMVPPAMTGAAGSIVGTAGATGAAGTGAAGFEGTGGFGGSIGNPDGGPPDRGPFPGSAQGLWKFDDCNASRTELVDSSFSGHTAFRAVTASCRPGILGSGILVDEDDDLVYVPDQPTFTFADGVSVAAWVKPTAFGGVRTIFRKREAGTSTFFLGENGKTFQFIIRLSNGKTADVTAPAKLDVFQHVAATYDGLFLRLYVNGAQAAQKRVVGRLSEGVGPLLMGNDASNRRIDGVIDNVFFDTFAATPEQIVRLTCLPTASKMAVTPVNPAAVAPGTPVSYDVQLTNNSCDDQGFQFSASTSDSEVFTNPSFTFSTAPVGVSHVPLTVTSTVDAEPATAQVFINAAFVNTGESFNQTVTYSILDNSTPCTVRARKELEIRDVSVVDDPVRTGPGGAWSFGKLMEAMAPTAADAPAMVEKMLTTFATDQTVNGFTLPARAGVPFQVLPSFPRTKDGQLDLSQAPFRLLAIANRIDLNAASAGTAGEGRFVFGFTQGPGGFPLQATFIIEYGIPAKTQADVIDLAQAWHGLKSLTVPSETYNAALQKVTERFTARNAAPGRPNGSALAQIRTNDFFQFGFEWEYREFHLDAKSGLLQPAPLALTPERSFNGGDVLGRFITANEPAILADAHTVPLTFEGAPFQGGAVDASDFFTWQASGVDGEARSHFARNTCNGCHTFSETGGNSFQISPRNVGQESQLSSFLTGSGPIFDPFGGVTRQFNELARRGRILHDLVCPDEVLPPLPPEIVMGAPGFDGGAGFGGGGGFGGGAGSGGGVGTGSAGASGGFDAGAFPGK